MQADRQEAMLGILEWKATRLSLTRPSTLPTQSSVSTTLVQDISKVVQPEHSCKTSQAVKRTQELENGKLSEPK